MWTRTRALPPATGSVRSRRSCSSSRAKSSPTRSSGRFRRPNSERSWTLSPDTPRGGDRISTSGIGIPSLSPTRDEFRALAVQGNLVPVFAELPADLDTPLSAYLRLRPGPYAFLLESVEGGDVWARYSFLGADPLMVLTAKNGRLTLKRGARTERLPDGDPLPAVRELLGQFQPVPVPGLPRFQGGAVGYLAYDMVHHMERLPRTTQDDLNLPDAVFLFTDSLLVFDNLRHRLLVIANAVVDKRDPASLDRAYDRAAVRIGMMLAKLARPVRAPAPLALTAPGPLLALGEEGFASTMNEAQFTDAVRRAKEHIAAGGPYHTLHPPRAQRRRAGLRAGLGEGYGVHGDRALLPRDALGEPRDGTTPAGDRRARRAPSVLPRGHAHRRAEDPRDGDHRRARADPARPVRRRRGIRVVLGQPRLVHHDPDDRLPRPARVGPGGRRHRRRL